MESLSHLVSVGGEEKDGCGHSCSHLLGGIKLKGEHKHLPKDGSVLGFSQPLGYLCEKKEGILNLKGFSRGGYTESNRDDELVQNILCSYEMFLRIKHMHSIAPVR